ncbi:MAG: class B sortase [Oscillospiraceae bacterium]|nr:class B sortase [Oscillospiraceae bacterium]
MSAKTIIKNTFRYLIIIAVTAVICLSGYELWKISERYIHESQVKKAVAQFRPQDLPEESQKIKYIAEPEIELPETEESVINQFIVTLQNEINSDIVGWINIPDTNIDYPFVISDNNSYYLRHDVFGNYAVAGTIFIDCRCPEDFTGFNTIIYGHNMNNNSMFGDLILFDDEGFFEENRFGTIFLKDRTYTLEFFAYMIIREEDNIIYNPYATPEDKNAFYEYTKRFARNYREPETECKVVTLSTCTYDGGARIVLLANIKNKSRG